MIQTAALGAALAEADRGVREIGGNNRGPDIRRYLAACDPPIHVAAPWCAAFVQWASDVASQGLGALNPLDGVRQEALVESYFDHFAPRGIVPFEVAEPGDLVLFRFPNGPDRWNHIGILARAPDQDGKFWVVEGNTGDASQRDGDGVYLKPRVSNAEYPVAFIRWHAAGTWQL